MEMEKISRCAAVTPVRYPGRGNNGGQQAAQEKQTSYAEIAKGLIRGKINEMSAKIQSGEIQESFQIGGRSYTMEEWSKFLERFDEAEDTIRKAIEEKEAKSSESAPISPS